MIRQSWIRAWSWILTACMPGCLFHTSSVKTPSPAKEEITVKGNMVAEPQPPRTGSDRSPYHDVSVSRISDAGPPPKETLEPVQLKVAPAPAPPPALLPPAPPLPVTPGQHPTPPPPT